MADEELGLLATVRLLSASDARVSYRAFRQLLARENREVPVNEWGEVAEFASCQCGRWKAQWLLSPSASPDAHAEEEWKGWEEAYSACRDLFLEQFPAAAKPLAKLHRLFAMKPLLERRVRDNAGRPVQRLASQALSKAGILAHQFGMQRLGERLYEKGFYPRGTVARPSAAPAQSGWADELFRLVLVVVTFFGCWAYAIATWGWFLGLAFGWVAAGIIASMAFLLYRVVVWLLGLALIAFVWLLLKR